MKKNFTNLQLFGDPAGNPDEQKAPDTTGKGATPGAEMGDAPINDADALIEWKKRHVTVEEYNREKARADSYLKAIMENREEEIANSIEACNKGVDANKLVKDLLKEDNSMSDIEYVSKVLDVRKARMQAGERDPFLPDNYDEKDVIIAQNVADTYEECIRLADGNNASFIALLQSRIKDTPMKPNVPKKY